MCVHEHVHVCTVRTNLCMSIGVYEHVHVYTVPTSMCMSIGVYEHVRVYTVRTSEHRCVCVRGFERPNHQTLVLSRAPMRITKVQRT